MEKNTTKCLKNKIDQNALISFDIFDTLIFRNVSRPSDIFERVSVRSGCPNFRRIRVLSERIAQKKIKGEVKLEDIYNVLSIFYSKKKTEELLGYETTEEILASYFNHDFEDVLEYCKKKKKRVVLTSDMYLPLSVMEKIISKIPYEFAENDVNISSTIGCSKKNGALFAELSKKYNVAYDQIIHIGDNQYSDYEVPKKMGLNVFKYTNAVKELSIYDKSKRKNYCYQQLCGFIRKYEPIGFDLYEKIGYEVLGPLLAGYCYFLNEEANESDTIIFLARDGLVLKKSFEKLYGFNHNTKYLYGSRKAFINPTLCLCKDKNELLNAVYLPYKITGEDLLKVFNINDVKEAKEILRQYNALNKTIKLEELHEGGHYTEVISRLYSIVVNRSNNTRTKSSQYLDGAISTNSFILVDIGWNGNMQKALQRYCINRFGNSDIKGVYVGLNPFTKSEEIDYCGYVEDKENYQSIKSYISLFEFFFTNHEGSVLGYNKDKPILDEPEYQAGDSEYQIIDKVQGAALRFVEDVSLNLEAYDFYKDRETCFTNINLLGTKPTLGQVKLFENVRFKDSVVKKMVYSCNPLKLKTFIACYRKSLWRVGLLKKSFRVQFNYYKLNVLLRRIFIERKNDF